MLSFVLGFVAACALAAPAAGSAPPILTSRGALQAVPPPGQGPITPGGTPLTQEERERLRPKLRGLADPELAARGARVLAELEARLGAVAGVSTPEGLVARVPLGAVLPGVRFEALFTTRVLWNAAGGEPRWRIHHRVPVFARYRPDSDGYRIAESVQMTTAQPPTFETQYTRLIRAGDRAWSESGATFLRTEDARSWANAETLRDFALGAFPLALRALDVALAPFVPPNAASESGGVPAAGELFEMRFGRKLRFFDHEWCADYYLGLNAETGLPAQIQFSAVGFDRANLRSAIQWAYIDFDAWTDVPIDPAIRESWRTRVEAAWAAEVPGEPLPADRLVLPTHLKLPTSLVLWRAEGGLELVVETVSHAFEPLHDDALRQPWQHRNELWRTDERADHWDPPVRTPGHSDSSDKTGATQRGTPAGG